MIECRLRLWLLLASSLLVQTPVEAGAEWVALDVRYQSHPLQTAYIDPDTIHREGNVVALSALIEWKEMQGGRTPTRFYSTKITKQFDCAQKLVRTLAATDFYGHMGTGEIIGGGSHSSEIHWVAVEPGTINHGLWNTACRNG